MGKVKDTYIRYGEAGDQYVGRVVSGLNVLSPKFACTPPYFRMIGRSETNNDSAHNVDAVCTEDDVDSTIRAVFTFPFSVEFIPVARMSLACLIYAMPIFDSVLPKTNCPIRSTPLFTHFTTDKTIQKLHCAVTFSHTWDSCKYWNVQITGIPPHIRTYIGQEEIKKMMEKEFSDMKKHLKEELDLRSIGGGELTIDLMKREFTQPLVNKMTQMSNRLNALESGNPLQQGVVQQTYVTNGNGNETQSEIYRTYVWGNDSPHDPPRLVPECFRIDAKMTLVNLWHHWHVGFNWSHVENDESNTYRIRPLKTLRSLKDYPGPERSFSRARKVCKILDKACGLNARESPSIARLNVLFHSTPEIKNHILPSDLTKKRRKRTRDSEYTWGTVAREYEERNVKRRSWPAGQSSHEGASVPTNADAAAETSTRIVPLPVSDLPQQQTPAATETTPADSNVEGGGRSLVESVGMNALIGLFRTVT